MVIVLLGASLCLDIVLIDDIHTGWAYRPCFLVQIGDHACVVLADWSCNMIKVTLRSPVGR